MSRVTKQDRITELEQKLNAAMEADAKIRDEVQRLKNKLDILKRLFESVHRELNEMTRVDDIAKD